jgi:hypothetical protein
VSATPADAADLRPIRYDIETNNGPSRLCDRPTRKDKG